MSQANLVQEPSDKAARLRALDPNHSAICVAPAGSGKTELLTQRMLVLLTKVSKPEEILAITFTRKAASEMQHRVTSALRMALAPEPSEPHKKQIWQLAKAALAADAQHQWHLINNPHRLQVRTFDGLCASLVKALPLQAQLGTGVALSDDSERLFVLAAESLLGELEIGEFESAEACTKETGGQETASESHTTDSIAQHIATLLRHLDNDQSRLRDLCVSLLHTRAAWLPVMLGHLGDVREALESGLANVRSGHLQALRSSLSVCDTAKLCSLADFAARHLPEDSTSPIAACKNLYELPYSDAIEQDAIQQWQGLQQLLQTATGGWRKRLTKNEGFPTKAEGVTAKEIKALKGELESVIQTLSDSPDIAQQLYDVALLPYWQYPDQQWQVLQALTALLPRLVAHLQWVFSQEGELDFTEMSLRAEQALGTEDEPTDLALRLDYRLQHILVDEFQDTSSQQMQLIQRLTAGWQPEDGRTVFCVGDAMQSIYAFRSANVGLFLQTLQGALGDIPLEVIHLETNFRSQAGIVDWVNQTFTAAFPAAVNLNLGAVPYSSAVPFQKLPFQKLPFQKLSSQKAPLEGEAIHQTSIQDDATQAATVDVAVNCGGFAGTAPEVFDAEAQWVLNNIQQVLSRDADASIAILGRGRKELGRVLPTLKAAGIRYRAVDLDPLASLSAVQDAWALTKALLNTSDVIAWVSVLRAPWCGLSLNELTLLSEQPGDVITQVGAYLARLEQQPSRLAHCHAVLSRALQERDRLPLTDWVKGVWLALGGSVVIQAEDRLNVERYFDALAELTLTEAATQPERLTRLLSTLYALPDPDATEQLQVMTMHKSKGLEFDAVFLVGLGSAGAKPNSPLIRWHEHIFTDAKEGRTWLLSPTGEKGEERDTLYHWLGLQQARRELLESCRLFYVACTRAKKNLYLSAELPIDKKTNEVAAPRKGSLLSHIWSTMQDAFLVRCQRLDDTPQLEHDNLLHEEAAGKMLYRLPDASCLPAEISHCTELMNTRHLAEPLPQNSAITHGLSSSTLIPTSAHQNRATPLATPESKPCYQQAVGTLVHELLEVVVSRVNKNFDLERFIQQSKPFWESRLQQLIPTMQISAEQANTKQSNSRGIGVENVNEGQWLEEAVSHVEHCTRQALNHHSPLHEALSHAKVIHTEYPLMEALIDESIDNKVNQIRIDLWWQDEHGQVFLLDYKTAQKGTMSLEQFEQYQQQEYASILNHYADALGRHTQSEVSKILFLLDTQSWLVL